jgi:hypothetical protein
MQTGGAPGATDNSSTMTDSGPSAPPSPCQHIGRRAAFLAARIRTRSNRLRHTEQCHSPRRVSDAHGVALTDNDAMLTSAVLREAFGHFPSGVIAIAETSTEPV